MIWWIILGFIAAALFVFIYDWIFNYLLLKKYYSTYLWIVHDAHYLMSISGPIRKGKTTLMYGLSHLFTLRIKDDLERKMQDIETILIDTNFRALKMDYLRHLENVLSHDDIVNQVISKFLIKRNDKYILSNNLDHQHYNHLAYSSHYKMLIKY